MSREKTPGDQKVLEGLKVSKDQHNPHSPGDPKEKDTKDHKKPSNDVSKEIIGFNNLQLRTSVRQISNKDPIEKVPDHYIQQIMYQTGNHDPKYICQRYDEDYPIVNPNATTEWDRRGKPHGHDKSGKPTWNKDEVPKGIKMENMALEKLYHTTSVPNAPWQAPCADACRAKRDASDGRHAHGGGGDGFSSCSSSGYHAAQSPYEAAPLPSSVTVSGGSDSSIYVRTRNDWQTASDTCAAKRAMNSSVD